MNLRYWVIIPHNIHRQRIHEIVFVLYIPKLTILRFLNLYTQLSTLYLLALDKNSQTCKCIIQILIISVRCSFICSQSIILSKKTFAPGVAYNIVLHGRNGNIIQILIFNVERCCLMTYLNVNKWKFELSFRVISVNGINHFTITKPVLVYFIWKQLFKAEKLGKMFYRSVRESCKLMGWTKIEITSL